MANHFDLPGVQFLKFLSHQIVDFCAQVFDIDDLGGIHDTCKLMKEQERLSYECQIGPTIVNTRRRGVSERQDNRLRATNASE